MGQNPFSNITLNSQHKVNAWADFELPTLIAHSFWYSWKWNFLFLYLTCAVYLFHPRLSHSLIALIILRLKSHITIAPIYCVEICSNHESIQAFCDALSNGIYSREKNVIVFHLQWISVNSSGECAWWQIPKIYMLKLGLHIVQWKQIFVQFEREKKNHGL